MNRIFKYISASALLLASFVTVANAQLTEKEQALIEKSVKLDKWTTPGPTEGSYYLNLETFITGYTSNVTKYETTTVSTPLDIVLLLDVSGSMSGTLSGNQSRIAALKSAVKDFITTIKNDADINNVEHRISLIKFASAEYHPDSHISTTTTVVTGGTPVCQSDNTAQLKTNRTYYIVLDGTIREVTYTTSWGDNKERWRYNNNDYWNSTSRLDQLKPATTVYSVAPTITTVNELTGTIIEGNTMTTDNSNYNRTQVVKNFLSVSENSNALATAVDGLKTGGATAADYGVTLANLEFAQKGRADAVKVLIFFTDGAPTHSNSFSTTVANDAILGAKILKEDGVKVYVVATIADLQNNSDTDKFLKYTSSNYPNAASLTNPGTAAPDANFSFNTTSASELDNVFQTISQETSQAAANANAGYTEATTENNVTIKDIVTSNFVIPSDADGNIDLSKIEIYTAKSTGVTRAENFDYQNYEYTAYEWAEPEVSTLEPVASRDSENGKTTVSVPGFDFSANWVGFQNDEYETHDGGKTYTRPDDAVDELHDGYKLIIKVLVEPDPNAIGGSVPTNDKNSGLYITKDGKEVSLKSYPVPGSVLVPMDLTIIMNGVTDRGDYNLYKPGETAIFQVTSYDGKKWNVAVTADERGVGSASIKVPFHNDAEKDIYTVTELSDWSYRFNSIADPKITGNPSGSVISKQISVADHTYYFVATDTEELSEGKTVSKDFEVFFYDENNKNNVFNSAANPTEKN